MRQYGHSLLHADVKNDSTSEFKINFCFHAKHIQSKSDLICDNLSRFIFFNLVLRPFQDYFSSYEKGQSVGGTKTREPRGKPPGTPASRTWLVSHVARAGLELTPDTAVR